MVTHYGHSVDSSHHLSKFCPSPTTAFVGGLCHVGASGVLCIIKQFNSGRVVVCSVRDSSVTTAGVRVGRRTIAPTLGHKADCPLLAVDAVSATSRRGCVIDSDECTCVL